MSIKTFDWPYHTISVSYPQRGNQVQLGGNWTYSTRSSSPVMRNFQLTFPLLKWCRNEFGVLSPHVDPQLNILRLEQFYEEHELHKDFIYPHEIYGEIVVKFSQPLTLPPAKLDSDGSVFGVTVNLVQQPV